ncbi:FadR/GntR family transcriptional regulator [Rhodobium gokarnense]|uniref:GntR family transcriptional repressor for pyruvate dehydrogenase complex n=1 Tax=Rhodobium gokarnense TaxID=364296 RepID=A0ABT3H6G8_9HYPH|nr:FadR/GntR family transcriptional regulator [Rhodobium gokarnense]MCW2305939.1 GntR family transcriptional repressor for pyruvate dehydrogenase complex [Rhodobium gokarnense]
MPVEPIKPRRLYQEVADQLSRLIAGGEFKPGTRLPSERDLAQSLQVSRPTIREAMIALEIAGAIEIRTGSGVFVRDPARSTAKSVAEADIGPGPFELMEARIHIEGEAAAIAAERLTEFDRAALEKALAEMERLADRQQSIEAADREFHQIIGRATRNSAMAAAVDQLWAFRARNSMWGKLHELIGEIKKHRDWNDDLNALTDHRAILEAFDTGDAQKARAAMQAHLRRLNDVLMTASELDLIQLDDRQPGDKTAPAARE